MNLTYLMLMQRMINKDRELAMFRLKIDEETADLLSTVSVQDFARLAHCNQLLCQFSLNSATQLYSLLDDAKEDDMLQVHAAILLSGQDEREGERRKGERRTGERRGGDRRAVARAGNDRRVRDRREGDRRVQPRRAQDFVEQRV